MAKRSRNLEQTRAEILGAAFREIYAKGFQGVSVDDIVKHAGVTKGAFYHHFATKVDLGYALVEEVITPMILDRWITPLAAYKNPLTGILKQLKKNIGERTTEELKFGCPLNNLVQEMAPVDAGFKMRLQVGLNLWITETQKHITRGQENGQLHGDFDARQVAVFVVMAHEGFYGLIKGLGDRKAFDDLYLGLRIFFQSFENN